MAMPLFPQLKGLTFGTRMTPSFNTGVSRSTNGKETRTQYQAYPTWEFELSYEWLPNRSQGKRDLESIVSFFLERSGSFEAFLYDGPETPLEEMTLLGEGDGVSTSFDLVKTTGSYVEPAGGLADLSAIQLYVDDVIVAYSAFNLSEDNRSIVFDTAPLSGKSIRGVYKPLYLVRFNEDTADFEQFMSQLWNLQQITLKSILP